MLRILLILALALSLVGCTGDRTKQSLNDSHAQPQNIGLLT
jgi:PBP1b-binding outer membrane lipoprotein LpoB